MKKAPRGPIALMIAAAAPVPCACGCGRTLIPVDDHGRTRKFIRGHNGTPDVSGRVPWNRIRADRPLTVNESAARSRARRADRRRSSRKVACECGCGTLIPSITSRRDVARYAHGHNGRVDPRCFETRLTAARLRGPLNPHWRGGSRPYPPEWTARLREMIRARDGFRCRRCGVSQDELGRTLDVHHLDHNKQNCDPSNLVAACGRCNKWASHHRDEPFVHREAA